MIEDEHIGTWWHDGFRIDVWFSEREAGYASDVYERVGSETLHRHFRSERMGMTAFQARHEAYWFLARHLRHLTLQAERTLVDVFRIAKALGPQPRL